MVSTVHSSRKEQPLIVRVSGRGCAEVVEMVQLGSSWSGVTRWWMVLRQGKEEKAV